MDYLKQLAAHAVQVVQACSARTFFRMRHCEGNVCPEDSPLGYREQV